DLRARSRGRAADVARDRPRQRAAPRPAPAVAPARAGARVGAGGRGGRIRRPEPAGMSELLELSAGDAAAAVAAGELDAGELWDVYRERAAADDLNAFT